MPLTRKIPLAAKPIVEILRRDVPRPRKMPKLLDNGYALKSLTWFIDEPDNSVTCACPMGLHPRAKNKMPTESTDFSGWDWPSDHVVQAFAKWWDEQTDAEAAVNAVWPRKKRWTRR